jgi:hypothetical protein
VSKKFYETPGFTDDFEGSWHHFVVTFDGLDVKWYVGCNLIGTASSPTPNYVCDGNWDMTVGYHQFKADRNMVGSLQDFRIYNKAMSAEEVHRWYSIPSCAG